jgi:uncharacterized protein (DUF2384 family)
MLRVDSLPSSAKSIRPTTFSRRENGNKENRFTFREEEMANRVAKAMVHAVELCGGGAKPEPF